MAKWLDIKGPVVADTVYADSTLVAKDVAFTLPGIEFLTADVQAMGNMTVPLIGLLENMELSITKIGVDNGLRRMNRLKKQSFEFRWVQNVVKSDGSTATEGCKAFVRTMPGSFPELGVEVGSATEAENTYNVTRLQIYANGVEICCVDRLAQILRINGEDYMSQIEEIQDEQKKCAEMIEQARELQQQAKQGGESHCTTMPQEMKDFFTQRGLSWDTAGSDDLHNADEWDYNLKSLTNYQEQIGNKTQTLMVYLQDFIGQYNSYQQGASSAISEANQTLSTIARGQ